MDITAILEALNLVENIAMDIYGAVPGPEEEAMRAEIQSLKTYLAGGHGGMAEGQRQALQAQGNAALNAQMNEALARYARGYNTEAGASGQQAANLNNLAKARFAAQNQLQANIRNEDLAEAARRRNELHQLQEFVVNKATERKISSSASGVFGDTDAAAFEKGQESRGTEGEAISGAADTINSASAEKSRNDSYYAAGGGNSGGTTMSAGA